MKPTLIVSCTQKSNQEDTHLWKSWQEFIDHENYTIEFITNNTKGLSECYNKYITSKYAESYDFVVFVHDDMFIDDSKLHQKLHKAHNELGYDIVGIAGGINPEIKFPALWHLMCTKPHHRGQAAHPHGNNQIYTTVFGPTPSRVVIADGCLLGVYLPSALKHKWKFNENYKFHHYDIASCIDAHLKGMKVGIYPIHTIHSSPGLSSLEDKNWNESNNTFLKEYSTINNTNK